MIPRLAASAMASVLMAGCATPAGKFSDGDFRSKTVTLQMPAQQAAFNFYNGVRSCAGEIGVLECAPSAPDGTSLCDVYLPDLIMSHSIWVLGRVEFHPMSKDETRGVFRVNAKALWPESFKSRRVAAWERAARGNVGDCR